MKKIGFFLLVFSLAAALVCFAKEQNLLIDGFEFKVAGGPDGNLDFGAGNGSSVEVTTSSEVKYENKLSLEVKYDAVSGGYIWVARGSGLDAKNAGWLLKPEAIIWSDFSAIAFYMYGSDSKTMLAFDVKDNGGEIWRFMVEDNFKGWKEVICSFDQFFPRDDWQPDSADKNGVMDFPLQSYQFEPLPESKGTLYFDQVELIRK